MKMKKISIYEAAEKAHKRTHVSITAKELKKFIKNREKNDVKRTTNNRKRSTKIRK